MKLKKLFAIGVSLSILAGCASVPMGIRSAMPS